MLVRARRNLGLLFLFVFVARVVSLSSLVLAKSETFVDFVIARCVRASGEPSARFLVPVAVGLCKESLLCGVSVAEAHCRSVGRDASLRWKPFAAIMKRVPNLGD